jgi:diadenosine tetraphosphate (Ap4A) HIT family hydrolase
MVWNLVGPVRRHIEEHHAPDGGNLRINVGAAAGRTVARAHFHVIPRYAGDAEDPRGGIRWVVPAKAAYWRQT